MHFNVNFPRGNHGEKKLLSLRKKVNELHFKYGLSKRQIARTERVSMKFVIRWTNSPGQMLDVDKRGWPKGKARHLDENLMVAVLKAHRELIEDPKVFFHGATAVLHQLKLNGDFKGPLPSMRTIGRILTAKGLTKKKKVRQPGASAYLCYPEHTIYTTLGGRVLEGDFIGKKFIDGHSAPVNFIGFCFKKPSRLRYYERIESQTSDCFIRSIIRFMALHETPDFVKVDNCLATIGSASGKRNISKTMAFLFDHQINPIFSVPRRPFTQASLEGNNSVFSRHFWNRTRFTSLSQIDTQLEWFNASSKEYTEYQKPLKKKPKTYKPAAYFIRQVIEAPDGNGFIDVLNEKISLKSEYINYYVLAKWCLEEEQLTISIEKEKTSIVVKKIPFKINKGTKTKC